MSDEPARPRDGKRTAGRRVARGGPGDKGPYYIQAARPTADERTRVLKQGDTFGVFDHYGDVKPIGLGEEGLYHEGTRFLSCLLLELGADRPMFLSSTVREVNDVLAVDLTNPDLTVDGRVVVPRGTLHVARSKLVWQGACYERLHFRNYGLAPLQVSVSLHFEADFADIFEVRGTRRKQRGEYLDARVEGDVVFLAYRGLDGVIRQTRLAWSPRPASLAEAEARYEVSLPPQGESSFDLLITCEVGPAAPHLFTFDKALAAASAAWQDAQAGGCSVRSTNEQLNDWVSRAAADLHMMTTDTAAGPYPYAGVPWFSTPFGRDGILTALECLWLDPDLARGVLAYLASTQATAVAPEQDAEPGKILHETRRGEMAALGEVPFGRYYGSIDATPLFVVLAGAYHERTGDRAFVESIWPNVEAALAWIDRYGDVDGDGFVEYQRHSPKGLVQQGWKDSHDSIFHADGSLARPPVALCEVQGYVYAAKQAGAALARLLGRPNRADVLTRQAEVLRARFEEAFWCDDLGTYALALDGAKRPCRVRTSNPGHCLLAGIVSPERARRTAATLLGPASYSGWGVRTVAAGEARYNPMSYHNGSVWPHDNALIALGLARYGLKAEVVRILEGLFEAVLTFDLHRMPELFCGFPRRAGEGPVWYPVACAPQAWSAAAVFALLRASLGLCLSGPEARVTFAYPLLPESLREVSVRNLRVGAACLDLLLLRHGENVGINVLRRDGDVEIVMVK